MTPSKTLPLFAGTQIVTQQTTRFTDIYLNGLKVTKAEFNKIIARNFSKEVFYDTSCEVQTSIQQQTHDEPETMLWVSITVIR